MKLRYYLRGLGAGMLVTALILILSGHTGSAYSDEEIKQRAAALGMVEKDTSVLYDPAGEAAGEEKQAADAPEGAAGLEENADAESAASGTQGSTGLSDDTAAAQGNTENGSGEKLSQTQESGGIAAVSSQEEKAAAESAEQEKAPSADETEKRAQEIAEQALKTAENAPQESIVTFVVKSGESSVAVARRAEEAGLVESAEEFDNYLCRNGYDKRIAIGSYEISTKATEKEIADKITGG